MGIDFKQLVLSALLVLSSAPALANKVPELKPEIAALDGLSSAPMRPMIADQPGQERSHRVPGMGIQIHGSCFDAIRTRTEANKATYDRAKAEEKINSTIATVFDRVMNQCRLQYPELSGWLREWVGQAVRTVITCQNKSAEELDMNAFLAVAPSHLSDIGERASSGIPLKSKNYSVNHEPVIVLSRDGADSLLRSGTTSGQRTLVHEILHSTHANNTVEHNTVQRISFSKGSACKADSIPLDLCKTNFADDRINVVSNLCIPFEDSTNGLNTGAELLYMRIAGCGIKKGCVDLFTSTTPEKSDDRYYTQSERLTPADSESLCKRAYAEGFCHHALRCSSLDDRKALLGSKLISTNIKVRDKLAAVADKLSPELRSTEHFQNLFEPHLKGKQVTRRLWSQMSDRNPELSAAIGPELYNDYLQLNLVLTYSTFNTPIFCSRIGPTPLESLLRDFYGIGTDVRSCSE